MNVAGGGGAGRGGAGVTGMSSGGAGAVTGEPTLGEIPPACGSFAPSSGITSPTPPCAEGRAAYSVLLDGRVINGASHGAFTNAEETLASCNFTASTMLSGSLTRELLASIDVLAFMPKRGMMPEEERTAARDFIQNGGSVLVFADYAAEATTSVENYQALLDFVGAVHGNTNSGVGPTFPKFAQHPITEGIQKFAVYAATALSGDGYEPIAALGCPIILAKDTGTNRFVVSGDATPIYGQELPDFDNARLLQQMVEWLVRER
jgi:hypothetical protein